jgi:NAD(P)-dependent dehydrogenase (short-subunit alcohol dehydrogenase family)
MTTDTRITTQFGFESTAAEVASGIDLSGKRAIVTGGASGIGIETARALAGTGAEVTLAVRDTAAGEKTASDIRTSTGNDAIHVGALDLADLASVRAFADAWDGPLHLLVNNAGVMALPELQLNDAGWEMQFATNHLGHFALALGLHDALAADGNARIVSLSSSAHQQSPVVFDDINFAFREYGPFLAYGQSKTANVLFAVGATERWAADGITANAVMPGGISTRLQRHLDAEYLDRVRAQAPGGVQVKLKTPEQGAATSVLLASSPLLEGVGGRYFDDCNEAQPISHRGELGRLNGVAPFALDRDNADRLWELSATAVG